MKPAVPSIVITLEPGADDSLAGHVQVTGEADRPFSGWLGMLSALERSIDRLPSASAEGAEESDRGAGLPVNDRSRRTGA
jgi:hypothetical protein